MTADLAWKTNQAESFAFDKFIQHIWGETVLWGVVFIIQTSDRMQYFTVFQDKLHSVNIQDDQSLAFSETVQKISKITYSWFATTWQDGHVGGQNKRIFPRRIYMKIEFSSQRTEMLLFLTTNMAAVTSRANQQYGQPVLTFDKRSSVWMNIINRVTLQHNNQFIMLIFFI